MKVNANTITTMGIISNEVYNNDYFTIKADGNLKKDTIIGTTYKVLDHTPASNDGFNALLLKDETADKYVISPANSVNNSLHVEQINQTNKVAQWKRIV